MNNSKDEVQHRNNTGMTETCPHCGKELSPWEQVLLNVDRTLMCKNCWYRIILDVFENGKKKNNKSKDK